MISLQLKSLSDRVFVWGLLGPVLLLISLTVGLMKAPLLLGMAVPLCVVFGLFGCWKWGAKGLLSSLVLLSLTPLFSAGGAFEDGGYLWFFGMLSSLAVGLFISSLGFYEVRFLIQKAEEDSARYLDDYLRIEENMKEQDEVFQREKQDYNERSRDMEERLMAQREEIQSTKQLLSVVRAEIEEVERRERDLKKKLLRFRSDLSQAPAQPEKQEAPKEESLEEEKSFLGAPSVTVDRSAISKLKVGADGKMGSLSKGLLKDSLSKAPTAYTLPAISGRVGHFLNLSGGSNVEALVQRVTSLQKGLELFQKEGKAHFVKMWAKELLQQEKGNALQEDLVSKTEEVHQAWSEVSQLREKEEELQSQLNMLQEENSKLQDKLQASYANRNTAPAGDEHLVFFHRSTDFLSDEVKRLKRKNDLYKQLRKQFEEKTEVLDRAREEMFSLETKLLVNEIEQEEERRQETKSLRTLEKEILDLLEDREQMENELKQLYDLVEDLSGKIPA